MKESEIFFVVLAVFAFFMIVLTAVKFLRSGDLGAHGALLSIVRHSMVLLLLGAVIVLIEVYYLGPLREAREAKVYEYENVISIMEAQETVTISDKRINNGLFRISYYVTCSFTDSETGTEYTREVPVTEEQYNLLKIGDEWDYAHR